LLFLTSSFSPPIHRWFCHFDDDNYVNVPALVKTLRAFDHRAEWYLGKPSIAGKLEVLDRADEGESTSFRFATGGAGLCLSRPLATRMAPSSAEGRLESLGDRVRLPDDVTLGYVIEHMLGVDLTVVDDFHSHLEALGSLDSADDALERHISLSYSSYGGGRNVVSLSGLWDESQDPTR